MLLFCLLFGAPTASNARANSPQWHFTGGDLLGAFHTDDSRELARAVETKARGRPPGAHTKRLGVERKRSPQLPRKKKKKEESGNCAIPKVIWPSKAPRETHCWPWANTHALAEPRDPAGEYNAAAVRPGQKRTDNAAAVVAVRKPSTDSAAWRREGVSPTLSAPGGPPQRTRAAPGTGQSVVGKSKNPSKKKKKGIRSFPKRKGKTREA